MKEIGSYQELDDALKSYQQLFLLLYKKGSEQSNLAHNHLCRIESTKLDSVFICDVNLVRDIHSMYGITTAPSFLYFREGKLKQVLKGAQSEQSYKSLITGLVGQQVNLTQQKVSKSVIVYTTPTCSWCNTLKSYLRQNRIVFREIDVTKDEKMAQKMVQKSGQQGVPQTEINGQMIVGFDRNRIDQLLNIN